eukprot:1607927-Prymnesium_polylepis.1
MVVPVRVAHDHADVDVHEEHALPRREVARDHVDAPCEQGAEARRKLAPERVVVRTASAAALLAIGHRERAPRRALGQVLVDDLARVAAEHLAACRAHEALVNLAAHQHRLQEDDPVKVVGRDAQHLVTEGEHVVHRARVALEEEDSEAAEVAATG